LLEIKIAVYSYENVIVTSCEFEEFSIFLARPAGFLNRGNGMGGKFFTESLIYTLVQKDLHLQCTDARTRSVASSRNANSCSLLTVGNPSRKDSRDSPALMYSTNVCTGTRVPANTGVPPMISGETLMISFTIGLWY
jgi:hypothetical protein